MAILRLSKGSRDFVLKPETEGYWDKRIEKLEKEIADLSGDSPELPDKKEELEDLSKLAGKAKKKLTKHGPTVWTVHSIDKESLKKEIANSRISLGKAKEISKNEVTSGMLGYSGFIALKTVKLGLDGWKNLLDENGGEIPFDRELIGQLDDGILTELANEINGTIDEEEEKN